MELQYLVKEPCRISDILQKNFNMSHRLLTFLIKSQLIYRNGTVCDTRDLAQPGDSITIFLGYAEDTSNIIPTQIHLEILYEDDWMLVLLKPSGISIHPSMLHYTDSLSNGVRYYFDQIGLPKKIRPVNRLDFYTSGLVIFAKCAYIHEQLSWQMQQHSFEKDYLAMVHGHLAEPEGTIQLPIARKNNSIIERCVDFEHGQTAITTYQVVHYLENSDMTLVRCHLLTGRTHQIRVHFSSIGHPLVGDSLYGNDVCDTGQMLHCTSLSFTHPVTKKHLHFESPAPF